MRVDELGRGRERDAGLGESDDMGQLTGPDAHPLTMRVGVAGMGRGGAPDEPPSAAPAG